MVNVTIICNYNGHNKYFYASITVVFDAECPLRPGVVKQHKLQTPSKNLRLLRPATPKISYKQILPILPKRRWGRPSRGVQKQ